MEDWNMLAADCVVISCCCQCLILQIVIFVLLKLPCKLIRKTKEYAKRKFQHRKKEEKIVGRDIIHGESIRIQVEEFAIDGGHGCGCCMEEVEKALEELSQKGEFAFGSFWGREGSGCFSTLVGKQEFDNNPVHYQFIEMVGSFSYL